MFGIAEILRNLETNEVRDVLNEKVKGLWLWRDQPYVRVQYLAPDRKLPRPPRSSDATGLRGANSTNVLWVLKTLRPFQMVY